MVFGEAPFALLPSGLMPLGRRGERLHPLLAPGLYGFDDGLQVPAFGRKLVLDPDRHLRIDMAIHDTERFELFHPIGQHFIAHLRNLFLHILEPFRSA